MLRTREMEVFLVVAAELHFGRAAAHLHMTTSGVSQAIRSLERWIGGALLERTSRRVRLTPLGQQLLDGLKPTYDQLERVVREARRSADAQRPTFAIGFSATAPAEVQDVVMAAMAAQEPATRLVAVPVNPMDMFLWDERIDLGLDAIVSWTPSEGPRVSEQLTGGPAIRRSQPALLMSNGHSFAHRQTVHVEELAGLEVLVAHGVERLDPPWVPPATPLGRPVIRVFRREVRHIETVLAELAGGRLVHLTITDLGQVLPIDGLALVPLTGLEPFACRAVWLTAKETAAVRTFAKTAADAGRRAGWLTPTAVPPLMVTFSTRP